MSGYVQKESCHEAGIILRRRFRGDNGNPQNTERAYDLRNVEMVSVRQPLLIICGGMGVGLVAFTMAFFRYLYAWEIIGLFVLALVAVIASGMVGTLKVHSLAMRGDVNPGAKRVSFPV